MADLTPEQIAEQERLEKEKQQKAEERKSLRTEIYKDISKEYGFNAFEPSEVKQKLSELKQWQDSQKTEQEKLQDRLNTYETKETEWKKEKSELLTTFEATKLNIDPDKIDKALKLADGDPTKLEDVIKEFPSFVSTKKKKVDVTLNQNKGNTNNETVSPIVAAFRKKRGITN